MKLLELILQTFLLPGNAVLNMLNINIEEDGGMVRSFVNMVVWGTLFLGVALKFYT